MGRPSKHTAKWKLNVPMAVALRTERRYLNPFTKRPDYGARSRLVALLLEEFNDTLDSMEKDETGIAKRVIDALLNSSDSNSTSNLTSEGTKVHEPT